MATDEEAASLKLSHLSGSGSKSVDRGLESNRKLGSQSSTVPSSSRVEYMTERKASVAPICPTTIDSVIEHAPPHSSRDSTEVDLEKMGVRVDRSYSVNGGQGH
jgi:pheromone alpha factor receptor